MKKRTFSDTITILAAPVFFCALGVLLLISPDTASALLGRLCGWVLVIAGAVLGAGVLRGDRAIVRVLVALVLIAGGVRLLRNPLSLASFIGRFAGLLLLIRGGQDFFGSAAARGKALAAVIALLGLVLLLLPMTTSRLVFSGIGAVLVLLGIAEAVSRLRNDSGDNIIDAL